ncbi:5-hydroxytryptamine receptor 3A-like [Engraulis encrasicolus]|uniref:5-hydroxytryptamine receptor 3A-like n=1 Tax=Engraulis encrasicolus TaxID=184585 RepID=UPI002FCFD4F1
MATFCLVLQVLIKDLFSVVTNLTRSSSPWLRPVQHWRSSVRVHVGMRVLSILDVNWGDQLVWWDPSWYGGLQHISLPSSLMWTPDLSIREAVSEERQQAGRGFVRVDSSGWVSRETVSIVTLRCDLAMMMFPFDTQRCNLTLQSHLYTAEELELCLEHSAIAPAPVSTHGEWDLISTLSDTQIRQSQDGRHYSRLTFQLVLKRHPLFYVLNLLVPSALVMLVDLAGWCVPVESAERLPFKVTLLLGYTVYLLLATDLLPPFKDQTPMLGVYLVGCLVFLSISLSESALLLALGQPDLHTGDQPSPLHRLARRLHYHWPPPEEAREHSSSRRGVYLVGCLVFLSISLSESALLLALGQPDLHTGDQPSPLHRLARRLHYHWPPPEEAREHSSSRRGLKRSFRVTGSCGRDLCVMRGLEEELEEVGEELRHLNVRREERSDSLHLMEALDCLCFRLYAATLTVFTLALALLWTI